MASLIPQIHSFDPSVFNLRDCPTSLNRNGSGVEAISKECSTRSLSTDSLFAASKDADLSSIDSLSASSHRVVDHLWGATQNEREQSVWQSANRSLIRDCCWLSSAGRFWQLMDWMPGSVLPSECDTELILRGVVSWGWHGQMSHSLATFIRVSGMYLIGSNAASHATLVSERVPCHVRRMGCL